MVGLPDLSPIDTACCRDSAHRLYHAIGCTCPCAQLFWEVGSHITTLAGGVMDIQLFIPVAQEWSKGDISEDRQVELGQQLKQKMLELAERREVEKGTNV